MDDNYALRSAIFARQEQILKGIARQNSIMKIMPGRPAATKAEDTKALLLSEQAELATDPATWTKEKMNTIRAKLLPTSGGRRKRRTLRKHKRTLRKHKRRTHRR